jgi:2,3-bisphosphoglycerate-independent phosphoglycerate mutase
MKYLVVLADGMADRPIAELMGKTPIEAADTPNMDYIASHGTLGMLKTVPNGMVPESDTANLAVMGYDPLIYSHGRSPLEAMSMGIDLKPYQTAVRANLVCLSDFGEPYAQKTMIDHSSGEISTEEARVLIEECASKLCPAGTSIHTGVSYRHCFVVDDAPDFNAFSRPHDILGKCIEEYLPECGFYRDLMERSFEILNGHPVNIARESRGLRKANSLWFWSPGKKPALPLFKEKTGLNAAVICAVDLIKGIGKCAGMETPFVPGATGGCVTDYSAKARAAIEAFERGNDLVYIHIEAPDECGHKGDVNAKIAAIENIDEKIVGTLMDRFREKGEEYRIAVLPDHPTPICLRTHAPEPVPFAVYTSGSRKRSGFERYSEKEAAHSSLYIPIGSDFMARFISGDLDARRLL